MVVDLLAGPAAVTGTVVDVEARFSVQFLDPVRWSFGERRTSGDRDAVGTVEGELPFAFGLDAEAALVDQAMVDPAQRHQIR